MSVPPKKPEVTAVSTFHDYVDRMVDKETANNVRRDTDKLFTTVKETVVISRNEFIKRFHSPPPAPAFYIQESAQIFIISEDGKDIQEFAMTYTMLWMLTLHEKGHHALYPRTRTHDAWESADAQLALGHAGLSDAIFASGRTLGDNSTHMVVNLIEDALINYLLMFREKLETSDFYFGWFAAQCRVNYELPLMFYDVSRMTPIPTCIEAHHRFMTALCWFYFASDGPAPKKKGGKRVGVPPFRELFEVTCRNPMCGTRFVTWNWRCPKCKEWNNTLEYTPDMSALGIFTDERSPLVTASRDQRVKDMYAALREYFMWITKIDFCRGLPALKDNNIFINTYYRRLCDLWATLIKLGCKPGHEDDIPKFVQGRRELWLELGGVKRNYLERCILALPTPASEEEFTGNKDEVSFIRFLSGRGDRGIVSFLEEYAAVPTAKYGDFHKALGELSMEEVLPKSGKSIVGVFDPGQYSSPDNFEDTDPKFRFAKKMRSFINGMKMERWDQDKFHAEFSSFYAGLTDEEKHAALEQVLSPGFMNLLALLGINTAKFTEFLAQIHGIDKSQPGVKVTIVGG